MTWKPGDFGGIKEVHVPPDMLWVPDIILYNKYVFINFSNSIRRLKFYLFWFFTALTNTY